MFSERMSNARKLFFIGAISQIIAPSRKTQKLINEAEAALVEAHRAYEALADAEAAVEKAKAEAVAKAEAAAEAAVETAKAEAVAKAEAAAEAAAEAKAKTEAMAAKFGPTWATALKHRSKL